MPFLARLGPAGAAGGRSAGSSSEPAEDRPKLGSFSAYFRIIEGRKLGILSPNKAKFKFNDFKLLSDIIDFFVPKKLGNVRVF